MLQSIAQLRQSSLNVSYIVANEDAIFLAPANIAVAKMYDLHEFEVYLSDSS